MPIHASPRSARRRSQIFSVTDEYARFSSAYSICRRRRCSERIFSALSIALVFLINGYIQLFYICFTEPPDSLHVKTIMLSIFCMVIQFNIGASSFILPQNAHEIVDRWMSIKENNYVSDNFDSTLHYFPKTTYKDNTL